MPIYVGAEPLLSPSGKIAKGKHVGLPLRDENIPQLFKPQL